MTVIMTVNCINSGKLRKEKQNSKYGEKHAQACGDVGLIFNTRGVHELSFASEHAPKMDEVQAIITLRSCKEIEQLGPKHVGKTREKEEVEPEQVLIKEDSMKESTPPPFPQALRGKKKASKKEGIPKVLRQVKVNIPLLDLIK